MKNGPKIDSLVREAIDRGDFPGASLIIAKNGFIEFEQTFGHAQIVPRKRILSDQLYFDIASLTKPIATATLMMMAFQENHYQLDQKLADFFETSLDVTLAQLLNHTSGLRDWAPFYQDLERVHPDWVAELEGKYWIIQKILEETPINKAGENCIYSDLGYILLGAILEKIYAKNLADLFHEKIVMPLKLTHTFFQDLRHKKIKDENRFVSTEACSWRHKILTGEVMDDNCWAMGGIAGHAGLFSTAKDLFIWLVELLKAREDQSQLIQKSTFETFNAIPDDRDPAQRFFTLGFDTPSTPSSTGGYFSLNSLGHLGYSGTSFWWDLDTDLMVIFLTNRVHPTRKNDAIKTFRPVLHEVIVDALK